MCVLQAKNLSSGYMENHGSLCDVQAPAGPRCCLWGTATPGPRTASSRASVTAEITMWQHFT